LDLVETQSIFGCPCGFFGGVTPCFQLVVLMEGNPQCPVVLPVTTHVALFLVQMKWCL